MAPSSIGFGHQPFGSEQFGSADWAEEVTWKIIPEFYRNADTNAPGLVPNPLRGFIDAIKPLFQEIRIKLERFPTLWDANRCPFPQLPALAYNVGLDITSIQTIQLIEITAAPFTINEQLVGAQSGSTGFLSQVSQTSFTVIGVVGPGFRIGETFTGQSSKQTATVTSVNGTGATQLLTVSTFIVGESVVGSETSTRGVIGSISPNAVSVNTVTGLGFANGEELRGRTSNASGIINGIASDGKSEKLLRSQVLNASQLWTNKGTNKGYRIAANFEGLSVDITPLWAESCDPDPNGELLTVFPPDDGSYLSFYDDQPADTVPEDIFYQDSFAAWPLNVESVVIAPDFPSGRCRSFSLRLFFHTPDDTEIENFDAVSARIIQNIEKFRPIHVRFDRITFDGPRASTQWWRHGPAIADSYAAYDWNTQIVGMLQSSSQPWTVGPFTATASS